MSKLVFCIFLTACLNAAAAQTYSDAEARNILAAEGIAVNKPKPATSLENVRKATIDGIVTLKRASGCAITITGGTEKGHASGPKSHSLGYKLDIRLNSCVNNYIKSSFKSAGKRRDGADLYKSNAGNIYALEGNHWDITYV